MEMLRLVTEFLTILEDKPYAAIVLIALAAVIRQWPPKA
jgi:hypothetical protein